MYTRVVGTTGRRILFTLLGLIAPVCRTAWAGEGTEGSTPAGRFPAIGPVVTVSAHGEPLSRVFSRLSGQVGLTLKASRELERQRVSLFVRDYPLASLCNGLAELLEAEPGAGVLWVREARSSPQTWVLYPSARRRLWMEERRNWGTVVQRRWLEQKAAEFQRIGREELDAATEPRERRRHLDRFMERGLAHVLGDSGREQLLAGEIVLLRFGDLMDRGLPELREWLRFTGERGGQENLPEEELREYILGLVNASHPTRPEATRARYFYQRPGGGPPPAMGELLKIPHVVNVFFNEVDFTAPPPGAPVPPQAARVTFLLRDAPKARPGETASIPLEAWLERLAAATGRPIIADGYLRPPATIRAHCPVKDYPLDAMLHQMALRWNLSWRFQPGERGALLLRDRVWWLQDAADVPDATLEELRARRVRSGGTFTLDDLAFVSTLDRPQLVKLCESDLFPEARLLSSHYEMVDGLHGLLRFYHFLPEALKATARTDTGLALPATPPDLVRRHLRFTLITQSAGDRGDLGQVSTRNFGAPGELSSQFPRQLRPARHWCLQARRRAWSLTLCKFHW